MKSVTGDASSRKVTALFDADECAREVAARLLDGLRLVDVQVRGQTLRDRTPGRKPERKTHGIVFTTLRAHARLAVAGVVGALMGAAVSGVFAGLGIWVVVHAAVPAACALIVVGGVIGVMACGAVTLPSEQDP